MPSVTLGEILANVWSRLDNNQLLYPRQDLVDECNDAVRVINLLTGAIQTSIQLFTGQVNTDPGNPPLSAPQLVYVVPDPIIFPTSVQYEGRELSGMSLNALASQYRSWATDVSYPGGRPVKDWAPIGLDKFVLHPMDGQGGRSLIVTGVCEPTEMVLDTDLFPLPNDDSDTVEDLVGSVLPIREGGHIFAAAVAELYTAFISKMRVKSAYTNLKFPTYFDRLIGWKPYTPRSARIPNQDTGLD